MKSGLKEQKEGRKAGRGTPAEVQNARTARTFEFFAFVRGFEFGKVRAVSVHGQKIARAIPAIDAAHTSRKQRVTAAGKRKITRKHEPE